MVGFGQHLQKIRKDNSSTQKQVAEAIGVNIRNYQKYESGEILPAFNILIALADYFNVPLDYLMGRTDNPKINK